MLYRDFGNTGVKISALGFGGMRLPMMDVDGKRVVDEEKAIQVIRKAYELGVNYFDSAYFYCGNQSEIVMGKALKEIRDKVYISTKFPYSDKTQRSDYRKCLEEQLGKLDTDHIDFYHFHGLNADGYKNVLLKNSFIEEALKAREEGLINHISFSFHDKPEVIRELVDTGYFETLLCQYNFLDRSNEESMAYAHEKGIGIVVMGPVAGGRIAGMSKEVAKELGIEAKSNAELALKFVLSNPNVDCALSGMSDIAMVEENAKTASLADKPLTQKEVEAINGLMAEFKRLAELYCTGCDYCMPCPSGIKIPQIFSMMNNYRVYGLKEHAISQYSRLEIKADACVECGTCETKCPQHIEIIKQLKECHKVLGGGQENG